MLHHNRAGVRGGGASASSYFIECVSVYNSQKIYFTGVITRFTDLPPGYFSRASLFLRVFLIARAVIVL
ncbi:hypothetical protein [Cronobacter sakazakii]|uniref:hypothetical protein n=3 Tax=Cronobacter sakazakii TaxID=28141 RepID=UPI001319CEEA|nr:hypothetical protein [Cronobacter sakazakii]ELY4869899.1 hypothetical protein [Cronobacter sakazakii]ELY6267210.1 hypothetical protein [Cronobacter sakazakii]